MPSRPLLRRARSLATRVSIVVAAALSSAALAQDTPNNRADITHQDIQDSFNAGQVGGVYGYAWGSYTCNIGGENLLWASGGTPALAMNSYRLHDGVLMHIGLGNAKHGCCVANGSGCGTCQAGPGGYLRAGCRDIYSASFNSGQGRLGPRSGIDPYLGTFTAIPTATFTAISRRVQVAGADMSSVTYPGASWIAEGVYVCAEEEPGAQLNNASYRFCNVANTGATPTYNWTVNTGFATVVGQPAIYAWKNHGLGINNPDPSVNVVFTDVPSEGRFFAAGKARALPNNRWRYDYAVFNLNSHRSGGSFSVNVPVTADITNVGFNAPDYHSGEIYSNADWTGSKVGGKVVFQSPQDFATNQNTNALRWGTMYNFWFETDTAPAAAPGSVQLGLFRPGTPNAITFTGLSVPDAPVPCLADFNGVGGVSSQDVLDFLAAWFGNAPAADFNGVGGVSVQDVFDFLAAWFQGCN